MSQPIEYGLVEYVEIDEAIKAFGNAEYKYFRYRRSVVSWGGVITTEDSTSFFAEISKGEFDANYEQSRLEADGILFRCNEGWNGISASYMVYERRLTKPGWREKLIEKLKASPDYARRES